MSLTLSHSQSGNGMLEMDLLRIKNQPKLRIMCIAPGIRLVLHSALAPALDKKGRLRYPGPLTIGIGGQCLLAISQSRCR